MPAAAAAAAIAQVVPGQNIWTRVDKLMTHDVCGPGTFGIFQKEFGENAQVRSSNSSCRSSSSTFVCDEDGAAPSRRSLGRTHRCAVARNAAAQQQ
jgi:hypothetical protein